MSKLAKWWAVFWDELDGLAYRVEAALHGRWNEEWPEGWVILPPPPRPEEQHKQTCSRADMSAAAILEFVKTQKKPTTLFDGYIATERRREVMTDE